MNAGRWGRRWPARRWRYTRVRQVPWTPLFRALAQPPIYPRRAWLWWVGRAQARRREWLEEDYEESELYDQEMEAEAEDEEEGEQRTPQEQPASPPKALPPAQTRRTALFAAFDEMKGQEEEFLKDGRPRVENVNDRLRDHGQEANATRTEIDEAFAAWKQSRGSETL
jgi:hypothetical protein